MRWRIIGYAVVLAAAAAIAQSGTTPAGAGASETFRGLYEQGYYDEAIHLLDSLVPLDSVIDREKMYYLAACHVARGDREKAAVIFEWILADDPAYSLDTMYTPPKILDVFREARLMYGQARVPSAVVDLAPETAPRTSPPAPAGPPDGAAVTPENAGAAAARKFSVDVEASDSDSRHRLLRGALRGAPGLLPLGGGHFLRREPVRGALLCAAQAASLGVCIWAFRTREGYYDAAHGWYAGNRAAYDRYTGYTLAGATCLLGSYTFGVIEYFYGMRKSRTGK